MCGPARPPVRASVGSLIEIEFVQEQVRQGIVVAVSEAKGPWQVPWLTVLFNDGKRELIRSPDVRVISRRRRKPRRKPSR
jgi:hypothetical protein